MKPKTLKSWEEVKNKRVDLKTLRPSDRSEDYYYQFDGYIYYPAIHKLDLEHIPEPKDR